MEDEVSGLAATERAGLGRRGWWISASAALGLLAVGGYLAGTSQRPTETPTTLVGEIADGDTTASTTESTTTASSTTLARNTQTNSTQTTSTQATTTLPTTTSALSAAAPTEHVFPISPASGASYASSHHDYPAADMFAPCGSDVVAPFAGTVQEITTIDTWTYSVNDPATRGGLSFSIVGDDGVRYYGSHLESLDPAIVPGAHVGPGQRIGAVGDTGNAAGTGCHLHFGISVPCGPGDVLRRRGEFWPQPYLDAWRNGETASPAIEAQAAAPC